MEYHQQQQRHPQHHYVPSTSPMPYHHREHNLHDYLPEKTYPSSWKQHGMPSSPSSARSQTSLPFDQEIDHAHGMRFYEEESASQPGKIVPGRKVVEQPHRESPLVYPWQPPPESCPTSLSNIRSTNPVRSISPVRSASPLPAVRSPSPSSPEPRQLQLPPERLAQYRLSPPRISVPLHYPYDTDPANEAEDGAARGGDFVHEDTQHHMPALIQDDEPSALTYGDQQHPLGLYGDAGALPPNPQTSRNIILNAPPEADTDSLFDFDASRATVASSTTMGGASTYTKSAESEVEDMLKDIFFWGSGRSTVPGRRRRHDDNLTYDETAATDEDATYDYEDDGATYETETTTKEAPNYLVSQTLGLVGGGLTAAAAAIAWSVQQASVATQQPSSSRISQPAAAGKKAATNATTQDPNENSSSNSSSPVPQQTAADVHASSRTIGSDADTKTTDDDEDESITINNYNNNTDDPPKWDFFQAASDAFFGPTNLCKPGGTSGSTQHRGFHPPTTTTPLEDDSRLVDLAVQAAVSAHRLQGVAYDRSEIDIAADIKFSVVDLSLPLGLIFQENETGCWITKLIPGGNAAQGGAVRVGDQLAAVDGTSAIDMTVDDIAQLIRGNKTVELTFVRYVGPLRPSLLEQEEEGYEIQATETPLRRSPRRQLSWEDEKDPRIALPGPRRPGSVTSSSTAGAPPKSILKNSRGQVPVSPTSSSNTSSGKKRFRLFGKRKK